jgi:hypothetical protein
LEETLSRLDPRQMPVERPRFTPPEKFDVKYPDVTADEYSEEELSIVSNDLDIPAFLRRGRKIAIKTMG